MSNFLCQQIRSIVIFSFVVGFMLIGMGVHAQTLPWHLLNPDKSGAPASLDDEVNIAHPPQREIIVAVLDTGVRSDHPALKGRVLPGYDMVSGDRSNRGGRTPNYAPEEDNAICPRTGTLTNSPTYHGTEVASLIAGNGDMGVYGVAQNALILPLRLMGACPGSRKDMLDSILWAAGFQVADLPLNKTPAHIINMSLAGNSATCGADLQAVIDRVRKKGIIIVASAGNTFQKSAVEPATCNDVISVGAVNADGTKTFFTAVGKIDIVTVGGGNRIEGSLHYISNRLMVATYRSNFLGVGEKTATSMEDAIGTSFAAPLVSGALAVYFGRHGTPKPDFDAFQLLKTISSLSVENMAQLNMGLLDK